MANTEHKKAIVRSNDRSMWILDIRDVDLYTGKNDLESFCDDYDDKITIAIDGFISSHGDLAEGYEKGDVYSIEIVFPMFAIHGNFKLIDFTVENDTFISMSSENHAFHFDGGYDG